MNWLKNKVYYWLTIFVMWYFAKLTESLYLLDKKKLNKGDKP